MSGLSKLLDARDARLNHQAQINIARQFGWNAGTTGAPAFSQYGQWTAGDPIGLARPPQVFTEGGFAPIMPIRPASIDVAPEGLPRPQPRRWEYPVAWNMPTPPGSEGIRLASFSTMRAYADRDSLLRMCIDKRVDEICGMGWDIVPTTDAVPKLQNKAYRDDFNERRQQFLKLFTRPDPEYFSYHTWLKALLEDHFVIDAVSIYLAPRLDGDVSKTPFGSGIAGLMLLDGATIRPMLDLSGSRPTPPNVAYQQYIWGVPRVDMMDALTPEEMEALFPDEGVAAKFRGDQLLYLPLHKRTNTPYGFSHVEKSLVPTGIDMNKQKYVLGYYTEGNTPNSWVTIGNVDTPQQARQWQDSLDAMIGDIGNRHQVFVLPHGSSAIETKPNIFRDEYDSTNREVTFGIFGLTAMEMGFLPGGKSGGLTGGSGMSNTQASGKVRTATKPLVMSLKRNIFDMFIQQICGQEDMQWQWEGLLSPDDEQAQQTEDISFVSAGIRTRDEVRRERGWTPFNLPMTEEPTGTTGAAVQSLVGTPPTAGVGPGGDTMTSDQRSTSNENTLENQVKPAAGVPGAVAPGAPTSAAKKPAGKPAAQTPDKSVPAKAKMLSELDALHKHVLGGQDVDVFQPATLPSGIVKFIGKNLNSTTTAFQLATEQIERIDDREYTQAAYDTALTLATSGRGLKAATQIKRALIKGCEGMEITSEMRHDLNDIATSLSTAANPLAILQGLDRYYAILRSE